MTDPRTFPLPLPVKKLKYTHEAMVDVIIQDPTVTHKELGELFGFSAGWVQRVVASDAFQARLADRKGVLIDPHLSASLNERVKTVTIQSLTVLSEKLGAEEASAAFAMEALGVATKALQGAGRRA